jgi:uncharacterized metal-binding protein YceD (DUF177 family)
MSSGLQITLAYLPEEGLALSGELDKSVLATNENDLGQVNSPLYYEIHVQRFETELLVRGFLEASFDLTCVRTGQNFSRTITIEDFSTCIEIDSGLIDLTETMREEVLIELPVNPICEDVEKKSSSEINSPYFTVDKPTTSGVNETPAANVANRWSTNWDALDGFQHFSDKKD